MSALDLGFGAVVLALLFACVAVVGRASRAFRGGGGGADVRTQLLERRETLGEALRTVEIDYRMGRIDAEAFGEERARIEPALVAILAQLDALDRAEEVES